MMIQLEQVTYHYQNQSMLFDLKVNEGEFISILGPSGAGKSTLLHLLAGFILVKTGKIILNHQDNTENSPSQRPVSMLFQDNNLFTHLTVEQNLGLGLSPNLKLSQNQKQQLQSIAAQIGLDKYLSSYPLQLSGGQKQRVAIARCLLQHRPILLLDEPFSSLDPKLKKEMFMLLENVKKEYNLTVLMVTHQLEDINNHHSRCLVIIDGRIQFDGPFSQLQQEPRISASLGIE